VVGVASVSWKEGTGCMGIAINGSWYPFFNGHTPSRDDIVRILIRFTLNSATFGEVLEASELGNYHEIRIHFQYS
jgi:hypothetical protein